MGRAGNEKGYTVGRGKAKSNVAKRNGGIQYFQMWEGEKQVVLSKRKVGVYKSWKVWEWCIPTTAWSTSGEEKKEGR